MSTTRAQASRDNGKRGGRPRGRINRATLDKRLAQEYVRQRVIAEIDPLLDAQIAHAKGLSYLVVRDRRTGRFIRVSEPMARTKQQQPAAHEEIIEVWEKDPSVQAFIDLLNRALGKPVEAVELSGADQGPIIVRWQR